MKTLDQIEPRTPISSAPYTISASGAYYLTNNLALRGGYQVLWLDNIALASEAAESTVQVAGGTRSTVQFGRLWYNGVTFGIDYVW